MLLTGIRIRNVPEERRARFYTGLRLYLRALCEAAARRDQLRHAVTRCDNRIRDLTTSERKRRTHHLCNMGGAICAISPQANALSQTRFYALMEEVFALRTPLAGRTCVSLRRRCRRAGDGRRAGEEN